MTSKTPASRSPALGRRQLMQAAGVAIVAVAGNAAGARSAAAQGGAIAAEEHWAKKGSVDLYIYRKRTIGDGNTQKPVLFLVHGSTFSSRGSFDLQVPGRPTIR